MSSVQRRASYFDTESSAVNLESETPALATDSTVVFVKT